MSRICPICGDKIGFFSGKFIGEKYVCKPCYELHEKENVANISEEERELDSHNMTRLADAYAKPLKYQPWSWGSKKIIKENTDE